MSETSVPGLITFMHRRGETMWITWHATEQLLLATLPGYGDVPGVTREMFVPLAQDNGIIDRLYVQWVREYMASGWALGESRAEAQWPIEPWDVPDPLTAPCPF